MRREQAGILESDRLFSPGGWGTTIRDQAIYRTKGKTGRTRLRAIAPLHHLLTTTRVQAEHCGPFLAVQPPTLNPGSTSQPAFPPACPISPSGFTGADFLWDSPGSVGAPRQSRTHWLSGLKVLHSSFPASLSPITSNPGTLFPPRSSKKPITRHRERKGQPGKPFRTRTGSPGGLTCDASCVYI